MTPILGLLIGLSALAAWIYLTAGRGRFWRMAERDDRAEPAPPATWPSVAAVVPARNEADVIAASIGGLLAQDYAGAFRVILVDDNSEDGTAAVAQGVAQGAAGSGARLEILRGAPLEPGWTGKLFAMRQGLARASAADPPPDYILFTDADIAHSPDNLTRLVARAEAGGLVLTSLMAELSQRAWFEKLMIPAFVFFFDMLYPFPWAKDPARREAAAAGGCMLVRREALEAAGGVEAIRGEIIDDCAMGALLKRQGPIWLGLTHRARSLRPYDSLGDIGRMISRSAYAQLGYSPLKLIGTVLGLALVFLAPPVLALFASGGAAFCGLAAWVLMTLAFQPMLRFYGRSPLWGPLLPLIAALYLTFTFRSALDHWAGRGGMWKGRAQANAGAQAGAGAA
jgi:hopene-associated glycosyltransferase HpnB